MSYGGATCSSLPVVVVSSSVVWCRKVVPPVVRLCSPEEVVLRKCRK